ncbi:sister chromatid cohesion protein PDS5 homolog C-like [Solanum verrucosum]|uniref:sister chromatid cohesion protein PDS5 homolog C-like n=1 Tax=Solanum verrucosum TaxID=315347 RepID=UPI0020D01BA1|nr:sister chromatid cohesion protein PDS5 homolog C-like [Solanum verrucosum]
MATENAPDTVHRVKVGPFEATCCEPARQDDTDREKLKHTCLTNIMKPVNPEDVHPAKNVPKENQEGTVSHKLTGHPVKVGPSEAKFCEPVLQDDTHSDKQKDTCTTNIIKPVNPEDVQPATNMPKENQEGTGSHELTGSSGHHSLVSENHNNSSESHGHFKRKEIPINDDDELVVLIPIGDVPQSQVQKKDSLHLGLTWGERTKRTVCAKRKQGSDSKKNEFASDCDEERKSESSIKNEKGNLEEHKEPTLQQNFGMKQRKKKKTTNTEESGDKVDNSAQDSKRACTGKDHGAELIGSKIKVWWPLEQAFIKGVISFFDRPKRELYEGVVSSFDPVERKHKVIYDDGEAEKLRLHKERWEMLKDNSTEKDHGFDFQGHAVSSAT